MEFLVEVIVEVPRGKPESEVDVRWREEGVAARKTLRTTGTSFDSGVARSRRRRRARQGSTSPIRATTRDPWRPRRRGVLPRLGLSCRP